MKRSSINSSFAGFGGDFPFIDHARDGTWGEGTHASWAGTPWHQCIDSTGHVNSSTGQNKPWQKLFFIPTSAEYAGNWLIDWQGNGKFEVLTTGSISVISHTGADWTQVNTQSWSGTDCSMTVSFVGNTNGSMFVRVLNTDANSIGAYFKNFRCIRSDQIADSNAGKIWNPVLKRKLLELNPAVFRLLDYQLTNSNPCCRWEYRPPANYNGWSPGGGIGAAYFSDGAYPDATGTNIYSVAAIGATPATLTHGEIAHVRVPNAIVRGGDITAQSVSQANPAVVSATAHGLANGDLIQFYDVVGMIQLLDNEYTVAGATPNTFQLSGINSSGYTAFVSGTCSIVCKIAIGARASKQIKMQDGYQNLGRYSYLLTASDVFTFIYDQPTDSWVFVGVGGLNGGIPIEILMQLFVELAAEGANGTDRTISPWFCIPHMAMRASDANYSAASDFVKNMVLLLKNGDGTYGPLPAACDIWLEDSNETWNAAGGFWQTVYYARVGFLRWGNARSDLQDYSTLKAVLRLNDARTAYGAGSTRIKRVMGLQAAGLGAMSIRWDGSATLTGDVLWPGGAPGGYYDYLAVATYIAPTAGVDYTAWFNAAAAWNGGADPTQITVANNLYKSNSFFGTGWFLNTMLPVYKTVATTYNLGIVMYEGGFDPGYSNLIANQKAFADAIKADGSATGWVYGVVKPLWDAWIADSKCSLPCWFDFSGSQTWSAWYPDIYASTSPAWTMMVAFNFVSPGLQETPEASNWQAHHRKLWGRHKKKKDEDQERRELGILPDELPEEVITQAPAIIHDRPREIIKPAQRPVIIPRPITPPRIPPTKEEYDNAYKMAYKAAYMEAISNERSIKDMKRRERLRAAGIIPVEKGYGRRRSS